MKGNVQGIFILVLVVVALLFLMAFFTWRVLKLAEVSKFEKPKKQVKEEVSPTKSKLASGKQVYEIITDNPRDPQIFEVEVDPLDVEFGKTQTVTVKVKTKADSVKGEDFVLGTVICDEKSIEFPLKLKKVEGKEELITTWQGGWKRECNIEKEYQIKIFAKNIKGEDKTTLSLLAASCPTPTDGQDYTLSTSTVGSDGCIFEGNVNGLENGNIIIESGFTLTIGGIEGGQTIVFNSGYSITIDGAIAFNKTAGYEGQIKKTYLWMIDADSDNYPATTTQYYGDTAPTDGRRRYLMATTTATDCDDATSTRWQYLVGYADADGDGYYDTATSSICCGAALGEGCAATSTAGTDCDDTASSTWQYLDCYPDADGDGYGSSSAPTSTQCCGSSCGEGCTGYADNSTDCDDSTSTLYQLLNCYYGDGDGDGYSPNSTAESVCCGSACGTGCTGYVSKGNDCDDTDSSVYQNLTCYADSDDDGCGGGDPVTVCCGSACGVGCTGYDEGSCDSNDHSAVIPCSEGRCACSPSGEYTCVF